jgi:hypothetical protein
MTSPDPDLKSVFCEALERPPGPERDAFLEDIGRSNPALKAGVEELLAAHDQADRFLAQATKKLSQNQRPSGFVPGSVGPPVAIATLCARSNTDGTDPTARKAP